MGFGIRIEFIENLFERFLELNTKLKFIVTYVMCWVGFLFSLSIGKLISNILYEPVEVVSEVGTAKFHVVSSAVSSKMGVSYYSIVLSYFINNASACLIIVSAFVLVSHLYKKEISKDLSNFKEYLRTLLLFYLIVVINPITGFVGCFIDSNKRKVCVFSSSVIFIYHEILIIYDSTVSDMWGLKPEWRLLRALKMWGVSVPPESQPMKMGGWKVIRYDSFVCFKSSG
ncbi:hypothetical protein [Methanotorris igneus]|uniref:hypothetical protein n=1 Tax=Methanotorris igneus TaxID=2189 RepID=UPI0006902705|nr:hypothetical protein [Methanotorris igneus]